MAPWFGMFVGALSPQHAGWQCMLTGMLVQDAMGAMTGTGMRNNGTGGQLQAWQPAHGLMGGGAAAVLLRA